MINASKLGQASTWDYKSVLRRLPPGSHLLPYILIKLVLTFLVLGKTTFIDFWNLDEMIEINFLKLYCNFENTFWSNYGLVLSSEKTPARFTDSSLQFWFPPLHSQNLRRSTPILVLSVKLHENSRSTALDSAKKFVCWCCGQPSHAASSHSNLNNIWRVKHLKRNVCEQKIKHLDFMLIVVVWIIHSVCS